MIKTIEIENFKSIQKLKLELGRINVFIGENGAGKSNVLEAITLAGAAQADKLDNEFLASRGIRITAPQLMRSAFNIETTHAPIKITVVEEDTPSTTYELSHDNQPYSPWINTKKEVNSLIKSIFALLNTSETVEKREDNLNKITKAFEEASQTPQGMIEVKIPVNPSEWEKIESYKAKIEDFVIFSPENSALRTFEREGQIQPLGINGEGLFGLLSFLSKTEDKSAIESIKKSLHVFSWFKNFHISENTNNETIIIEDKYLIDGFLKFDQRSANEGFLYAAFYFALFSNRITPRFFAIDNVDTSLNPKLCQELIKRLSFLAKENDKQAILTTHNPAILNGLDLNDDNQRLFVISRSPKGGTKIKRILKPATEKPVKLSELFVNGLIGGLPKGF